MGISANLIESSCKKGNESWQRASKKSFQEHRIWKPEDTREIQSLHIYPVNQNWDSFLTSNTVNNWCLDSYIFMFFEERRISKTWGIVKKTSLSLSAQSLNSSRILRILE
jgi:hypothetical protein